MLAPTKKQAAIIIFILAGVIILLLVLRSLFFSYAITKITHKLKNTYQLTLEIKHAELKAIRSIQLCGVSLTDSVGKPILKADTLYAQIRVWPLIFGELRFRKIRSEDMQITLSGEMLDFLQKKHRPHAVTDSLQRPDYAVTINRIFNTLFSLVPREAIIDSFTFNYKRANLFFSVACPHFELDNATFLGTIQIHDSTEHSAGTISGSIDRFSKNVRFQFYSNANTSFCIPYINQKWGATVSFDSLQVQFNYNNYSNHTLQFSGSTRAVNFLLNHKQIAPTPVRIRNGTLNFNINAGSNFIELDSASQISFNDFTFSPYFKYEKDSNKLLTIRVPETTFDASKFFGSLPEGLFTSLKNTSVSGNLTYKLNFFVNLNHPDSIKLESDLKRGNFKIQHFGNANISMLNDTFLHHVFERDMQVYSILVGPENHNFVPLIAISPFLQNAILTSEDGSYFYHKGFNQEAFMNSISENIKQRRFARGGSTITMQLVKNVFLTRNKTISRKLEELLLVWIIENLQLVSKERMFEVYLNIIEFGPGIYGIKPAAKYYFKKLPSELSLKESIFLASIIPCPKYFKYMFIEQGKLKPSFEWYYKKLPEMMLKHNQITAADTFDIKPDIRLTGAAADLLLKPDTTSVDSLFFDEPAF